MSAALSYLVKKKKNEVYENAESRTDRRSTLITPTPIKNTPRPFCDSVRQRNFSHAKRNRDVVLINHAQCIHAYKRTYIRHTHIYIHTHRIRPIFGLPHIPRIDDNFCNTPTTDAAGESKILPVQTTGTVIDKRFLYRAHEYIHEVSIYCRYTASDVASVRADRIYFAIEKTRHTHALSSTSPRPLRTNSLYSLFFLAYIVYIQRAFWTRGRSAYVCEGVFIRYTHIHTQHIAAR